MDANNINPNSIIPLYKQISNLLWEKIRTHALPGGQKLPSETELMQEYSVSRITIRAAIKELVDDGLLQRLQGKGTFVCEPKKEYRARDTEGFSYSNILEGYQPFTRLLQLEYVLPPKKVQDFLGVPDGVSVLYSRRLRSMDDVPILIEHNYYQTSLNFLEGENLNDSLFSILKRRGLVWKTQSRSLEICSANREETSLLDVKLSAPLLMFVDLITDEADKPMFYSKQLYCANRLKFYL